MNNTKLNDSNVVCQTLNKNCRALTASHFFLSFCYIQNPLEMKADWYSDPSHSTAVLIGRGKKTKGDRSISWKRGKRVCRLKKTYFWLTRDVNLCTFSPRCGSGTLSPPSHLSIKEKDRKITHKSRKKRVGSQQLPPSPTRSVSRQCGSLPVCFSVHRLFHCISSGVVPSNRTSAPRYIVSSQQPARAAFGYIYYTAAATRQVNDGKLSVHSRQSSVCACGSEKKKKKTQNNPGCI